MPKNFYEASWIFFIYAFLGWVCEVIFMALETGHFVNRGFLYGVVCPIYGFGMLASIYLLYPLRENVFLLFIGAVVVTSAIELAAGVILERVFQEKWWDYSDLPFNFKGYICLKFSLLWGIGGALVIGAVHPLIYRLIELVPHKFGWPVLVILYIIIMTDFGITVATLIKLPKKMRAMVEIGNGLQTLSDSIGLSISSATVALANAGGDFLEEHKDKVLNLKEEYNKKLAEFQKMAQSKSFRIFKAFPALKEGRFKDIFERINLLKQSEEQDKTDE